MRPLHELLSVDTAWPLVLGVRSVLDEQVMRARRDARIAELGPVKLGDIAVHPFSVERFGTTFGLIPRPPDEGDDGAWWVEMQPGNCMAFSEPWDGEYDT